jgi:hypothetical protein
MSDKDLSENHIGVLEDLKIYEPVVLEISTGELPAYFEEKFLGRNVGVELLKKEKTDSGEDGWVSKRMDKASDVKATEMGAKMAKISWLLPGVEEERMHMMVRDKANITEYNGPDGLQEVDVGWTSDDGEKYMRRFVVME